MKARITRASENGATDSTRDTNTILTNTTTRSAARQVCIGDMEEELHKAFAMARLPGGTDFVYERDHDVYERLDDFCNWSQMSEPATPLVVSGPSGSGKSALLANWLLHYQRRLEQRRTHGGPIEDPFVFCHAVGCTRHGVDVDQLLWRLLGDLKERFDLARNVPNEGERLSWELSRFLELAGRKGRVIIIIDGLHRLQDKNGGETGLQWLPLQVPGNVRVIVTATNPDPNYLELHERKIRQHMMNPHQALASKSPGQQAAETEVGGEAEYESSHRRRKVLMELSRRKWPTLEVGPLERWRKRDIVEAYLKRSVVGRNIGESQVNDGRRIDTKEAGSVVFLTGLDLLSDDTIGIADGVAAGSAQSGGHRLRNWGTPGLALFPSMVEGILSSDATGSALYLRTLLRALDWAAKNVYDVRLLLRKALSCANSVGELYNIFFDSIEAGNHPTEVSKRAAEGANEEDGGGKALQDAIDTLVMAETSDSVTDVAEPWNRHNHQQQASVSTCTPTTGFENFETGTGESTISESIVSISEEGRAEGRTRQAREEGKGEDETREDGERAEKKEDDSDDGEDNYEEEFDEDEHENERIGSQPSCGDVFVANSCEVLVEAGKQRNINQEENQAVEIVSGTGVDDYWSEKACGGDAGESGVDPAAGRSDPARKEVNDAHVAEHGSTNSSRPSGTCITSDVPLYLSGGAEVEGFGITVGRAMALLHTVRHGLRSRELWSLLAALKASTSAQEKAEGTEEEAEARLLRKLLKNQNRLIDSIRLMDVDRDGVISTDEFRAAIVAMGVGLTEKQVENLIRSIDVDKDGELDMQVFYNRKENEARRLHWAKAESGGGVAHVLDGLYCCAHSFYLAGDNVFVVGMSVLCGLNARCTSTNKVVMASDFPSTKSTGKGEPDSCGGAWTDDTQEDIGDVSAFSDKTRKSLKSALSVLGVSHDGVTHNAEEHNIFVLGLDAEDLREVVFQRYVSSASIWHSRLVRFFQAQAPSPRRCEELPWHLNKCYRWHPLKNSLVNLRTFETMWTTTQLRRELMDYWKLLTEGPLHASEEAAAVDLKNDSKSRLLSLMMQESCNQGGEGASVSAADIIAVGSNGNVVSPGKVAPFDLVFEYNHAVEGWQAGSRPTISRLGEMVHTIGDFMREMSKLVQQEYASPPFLHMPLDYKNLEAIGIDPELVVLTELDTVVQSRKGKQDRDGAATIENARNKNRALSKPKGAPKDKLSHYRVAPFYYFQRWLWVQFPWMALARSRMRTEPETATGSAMTAAGSGGNRSICSLGRADRKGVQVDKTRRFWNVKRIDPFGEPSVNVSDDRLKSRLKAGVGRSAMTTLLDTRSHCSLLGDVSSGMVSSVSNRRHIMRAEAQELFGKPLPAKKLRAIHSTMSTGNLPCTTGRTFGGRGGFLSEDDSETNPSFIASPADLKTLGLTCDSLAGIAGGEKNLGEEEMGSTPRGGDGLGNNRGRRRKRRRDSQIRGGIADGRVDVSTLAGTNPLSPLPGTALVEVESFLASSTSIFPLSIDEEMVLDARNMAVKLRHIHDTLQGEVNQKVKRVVEMKRTVEERNSQDAYTMSRTIAGEQMIVALETRLHKVRSTTVELERLGVFYDRIIEVCVSNPPKDNRHLRALEEQVFLSKQQTTDLSGKVKDLLFQKDAIERHGINGLRTQLARTKAIRQKVNARTEQLREQIQKDIKSERRGLNPRDAVASPDAQVLRSTASVNYPGHIGIPAVGVTALAGLGKPSSLSCTGTELLLFDGGKNKEEHKQEALEQLAILVGAEGFGGIAEKFKAVRAREEDLKAQGETSVLAVEHLRAELEESRKILSDLQVVDNGGISGVSPGTAAPGIALTSLSKTSSVHREQRRLDDLGFQAGIHLAQSTKKALKAQRDFNDIRVGILHLANLIDSVIRLDDESGALTPAKSRVRQLKAAEVAAAKMMAGKPTSANSKDGLGVTRAAGTIFGGSTTISVSDDGAAVTTALLREVEDHTESDHDEGAHPEGSGLSAMFSMDENENVCKLLEACEERVCEVMEVCGFCADKGTKNLSAGEALESSKAAQHEFWHSGLNAAGAPPGNEAITEGIETPSVLDRLFMGRTKGFKSDGAGMDVHVFPPKAQDSRFERSMAEALRHQNEKLEMQETEANNLDRNAVASGVASFLEDALNSKSANAHLRRANMLVMGKQGKRAGFGLVMDDVLSGADIDIYGLADATRRRASGLEKTLNVDGAIISRNDLSTTVQARMDLKASAQATSSRRKHEDRKKALLKKRVDQTACS